MLVVLDHPSTHDVFLRPPSSTAICTYLGFGCDQMWIAVELNQRKNGLSPLAVLSSQVSVSSRTSASMVSIRLRVSGPVIFDLLLADAAEFGIGRRIVDVGGPCAQDAARSELLSCTRGSSGRDSRALPAPPRH